MSGPRFTRRSVPGRDKEDCSPIPPTDPDVKVSLIRFLGNRGYGHSSPAHNPPYGGPSCKQRPVGRTPSEAVDDSGYRKRVLQEELREAVSSYQGCILLSLSLGFNSTRGSLWLGFLFIFGLPERVLSINDASIAGSNGYGATKPR